MDDSMTLPKAGNMVNKAAESAHAAVDRASGAADSAIKNAGPALERAAIKAHGAVDAAADAANSGSDWLQQRAGEMQANSKQFIDRTCGLIAERPLTAIAVALVAGVLIGRMR